VTFNKESKNPKLTISSEFINPKILRSHLTVEANVQDRHVVSEKDIEVRVRNETCEMCSRMAGGYYEAILQIRATDRFPNKKEIARCLKIADNVIAHAEKVGRPPGIRHGHTGAARGHGYLHGKHGLLQTDRPRHRRRVRRHRE
jgi:nonsense-mediated mRNA decay protein 3